MKMIAIAVKEQETQRRELYDYLMEQLEQK